MSTTFNQIPPLKQGKVGFEVIDGELLFHDNPPEDTIRYFHAYRVESNLVLEFGDVTMSTVFADHDDLVDHYLLAFCELIEETLPKFGQYINEPIE